ncbi:hypothetical protein D9M68_735290 [compost metagenome]
MLGQVGQRLVEVLGQCFGVGQVAHAFDEQPGRQQQADADCQHHIEQHGEHQAGQQHQHVAARGDTQGVPHMARLAHVPGDHQQQGGQRRHGQVTEQRRQEQDGDQHHAGVNDRRDRRICPGAHVGGAAGERRGGGDTRKQWRDQVADALADQFGIGVVLAAGHAVGHDCAEQ